MKKQYWGYLAILALLLVIWFEVFRTEAPHGAAPPSEPVAEAPVPKEQAPIVVNEPEPPPSPPPFGAELPAISLHVQNATLEKTVAELNAALGLKQYGVAVAPGEKSSVTFTLDADKQPFWEVFRALNEQHLMEITEGRAPGILGVELGPFCLGITGHGARHFTVNGAVMLFTTVISHEQTFSTGEVSAANATAAPRLTVGLTAVVDPRVHLVKRATAMRVLHGTDDAGNVFGLPAWREEDAYIVMQRNLWKASVPLTAPPQMGTKGTFWVRIPFMVEESTTLTTVDDVQANLSKRIAVGEQTLLINRCDVRNGQMKLDLSLGSTDQKLEALGARVSLRDSAGKELWGNYFRGVTSPSFPVGDSQGPFRLELRVADGMKEISVQVKLQDVVLP